MKILHTSDWHLGRTLYSKKERTDEHIAFLDWLLKTIQTNEIDVLIIAGDIFDTASPNSFSQKLYYDFLISIKGSNCKNVVVVGGNHDSPNFLNAPKAVLAALNVTVIGNASENLEDEIIVIKDQLEMPVAIVCGVPFLRERDISRFAEGENYSDRSKRINDNIKKHYEAIAILAEQKRFALGSNLPIIATGHLSVAGGKRNEDDGVRDTYIGNIEAVGSDIFPDIFEYVALGHYHVPSTIKEHIRYCGSPIPMGFGEANQTKCVYVIEFGNERKIVTIEIPIFQKIESIVGNKDLIASRLQDLKQLKISIWVEIIYKGDELFPDFHAWINEQVKDTQIEVLKLQNRQHLNEVLSSSDSTQSLEELNPYDVFNKLMDKASITNEQKISLNELHKEIVDSLNLEGTEL